MKIMKLIREIFLKSLSSFVLALLVVNSLSAMQKSSKEMEINKLLLEAEQLWKQNKIDEAKVKFTISLNESKKIKYKIGIGYSSFYIASALLEVMPLKSHTLATEA